VKALQELISKLFGILSPGNLFRKNVKIHFKPEIGFCPICHRRLKVMKTDKRTIVTLHIGKFKAHITFLTCYDCGSKTVYVSKELKELVPEYCNFGYDVMVEIGKSVFQRYRTADEIICQLQKKNVFLSDTQVYILAKKFITYLGLVHREIAPKIRKFMEKRGGYILHIDGTCEGGSCHLITVIDALSGFVLDSIKIPTENSSQMIPMLQRIKENYGDPIAVVSDMGLAIILALTTVFENIPQFICHFHFLRDIGKDLFMSEYSVFQKQLKTYGISTKLQRKIRLYEEEVDLNQELVDKLVLSLESNTFSESLLTGNSIKVVCYALVLWASKAKSQGKAYAFPFDRQHLVFYQRLNTVYTGLKEIIKSYPKDRSEDVKTARQIMNDLEGIVNDKLCKDIEPDILEKIEVFDKLRKAMRIALPDGKNGLNDNGEGVDIKTIEGNVKKFYNWLIKKYSDNKDYKKMGEQIEKYWERLFADPIIVKSTAGEIKVQPQRTNNIMEQFFRKLKKIFLRKSGTSSTADTLKNMLADVPLIKNLENRDYMEIILNGKNSLEERFAEIDAESVRKEMNRNSKQEKMIKKIQKIIKDVYFPEKLIDIFKFRLTA